jgi:mediator of RNA polymerase II transcription subunit 6
MPPTATKSKTHESHLGGVSKENTPLPESIQNPKKALPSTNNSTALNSRLLEETLNISMKYGDEYMDDFPITGHPGSFNLATTGRREKDKLMVRTASRGPLQAPAKPTPPPTLKTDVPPARKDSKATKSPKTPGMPKPKRRKSKAQMSGGASPT